MAERNAMAVGYRASMLPIGNYEDGSIAFPVWPQVAVDAYEALGRLGRGEPPQPQDAVLANLAMTGGIAMPRPAGSIGMAGRPRPMPEPGMLAEASLTRMRAEDAVKPRPFPDAPQTMPELESYLQKNVDGNSRTRADEAWAADPTRYNAYSHGMADLLNPESQWWKGEPTLQSGGSVAPMAATGGTGMPGFEQAFAELDAALIDLDGDGVPDVQVPRNALASLTNRPPQSDASRVPYNPAAPDPNDDWWKGLQDPRFGPSPDRTPPEPPSVPMPQPGNMMAGNAMARYAQGGPVMTDAGMPIPQRMVPRGVTPAGPGFEMLPEPQMGNAMARGPQPSAPIGQNAATRNEIAPPAPPPVGGFPQPEPEPQRYGLPKLLHDTFGPATNAMANYGRRIYEDVASDPWGAVTNIGAWNPIGSIASGNASSVGFLADPVNRMLGRNAMRELTPAGRTQNAADKAHSTNVWVREQQAAREANPDVVLSRQPHWEVQGRGPKGRFQSLSPEAKAARERGIELRRREQQAVDRAKKYNEGAN